MYQDEARALVSPECLEAGVAELPTHAVLVTDFAMTGVDLDALHHINEWLEERRDRSTWARWVSHRPEGCVFVTSDPQSAGVLTALEQHGATAALRLIELINDMPDPDPKEPHG